LNQTPERPTVAVGCFVFNTATELLMIKRGKEPGLGLWTIPGGRVEFGESLVDACRREVKEETGVDVHIGPMVTVFEPRIAGYHYVIIDYLGVPAESSTSEPKAGDDASDARWVSLDTLSDFPLTTDLLPVVRQALALADETGFTGPAVADGDD